jgi:hypothetical protein
MAACKMVKKRISLEAVLGIRSDPGAKTDEELDLRMLWITRCCSTYIVDSVARGSVTHRSSQSHALLNLQMTK